jgi:hypothetical protein
MEIIFKIFIFLFTIYEFILAFLCFCLKLPFIILFLFFPDGFSILMTFLIMEVENMNNYLAIIVKDLKK